MPQKTPKTSNLRFSGVSGPSTLQIAVVICITFIWSLASCSLQAQSVDRPNLKDAVAKDHARKARAGLALFKSTVREILSRNCVECHGGKTTKADFDLTTRKKLMDSGYVGKTAGGSHLMLLIKHAAEPHMPFKAAKLAAKEIESLARWIDLGAPYDSPLVEQHEKVSEPYRVTESDREFWSFRPLQDVEPPRSDALWAATPIDRFIYDALATQGLTPNDIADRRTLIRRATFDLTGLPPTPDEVDSFVADQSADAYERLIDRLLESRHYGERWARFWMDVARFAESHGYEQDYDRPHAYHYRDFLIRAFNSDMPFHQFVSWQIAGDELAPDEPLALMATGFLGAGVFPTQLTEAEFESARYDELDDMIGTLGVSFLGLSVGCARCHDHKFDPIPSRDYYQLASVFRTAIRSEIEVDLRPEISLQKRRDFEREISDLENRITTFENEVAPTRLADWLQTAQPEKLNGPWRLLALQDVQSTAGTKYVKQGDGSWLATSPAPPKEILTLSGRVSSGRLRSLRIEGLTHPTLPHKGPGRAPNGNFALGNIRAVLSTPDGNTELKLTTAQATHQQNSTSLSVRASIDDDPVSGWAVDAGGIGKDQAAVFTLAEAVTNKSPATLQISLKFEHPNTRHAMGRIRISTSERTNAPVVTGMPGPSVEVLAAIRRLKTNADRSSEEWKTTLQWFLPSLSDWSELTRRRNELQESGPGIELTKMQVTSEGWPHLKHNADGRGFPHFYKDTYLLQRGDVNQKLEKVKSGYLSVLIPPGSVQSNWKISPPEKWSRTSFRRASLSAWLTDARTGAGSLVARVIVNRLWLHHFGQGIVGTPNDFGFQGERPTHPDLLEWMARDLISGGWRLKRMHRQIMLSNTYKQSSDYDERRAALDPDNRLLWRRVPRRLEAEAIRDSMLAVSNLLDRTMYGPGSLDSGMKRRSVYFFIKRSQLIPTMVLFDWPEHLVSIGQRATTTVAPQALMFMNSVHGLQYAEALARRVSNSTGRNSIHQAYRLTLQREPTSDEVKLSSQFINTQQEIYRQTKSHDAKHKALVDFCQTLLAMNEFIYVD